MGLHLVNDQRKGFLLYLSPLKYLVRQPGDYGRVKYRNGAEKEAIGYHRGGVVGRFTEVGDHVQIEIFFGPGRADIQENKETGELINIVDRSVFVLPEDDFRVLYTALVQMDRQKDEFRDLLEMSECSFDL